MKHAIDFTRFGKKYIKLINLTNLVEEKKKKNGEAI